MKNEISLNSFQKLKGNRLTDIENRLWLPRGRGEDQWRRLLWAGPCRQLSILSQGMDWEFGINRCKLLSIRWINSEVSLRAQATISCDQTIMEKNLKMNIYIYV